MTTQDPQSAPPPRILAPAGSRASFLAALAAGADAVYCGLKHLSARMAAKNFTISELAVLTTLAHRRGVGVYIALNSLLTARDLHQGRDQAGGLVQVPGRQQGIQGDIDPHTAPVGQGGQDRQFGQGEILGRHARGQVLQAAVDRVGTGGQSR